MKWSMTNYWWILGLKMAMPRTEGGAPHSMYVPVVKCPCYATNMGTGPVIAICCVFKCYRFIAVTQPIRYAKQKGSSRRYVALIAVTWIISVAVSSPIAFGMNYTEQRRLTPTLCTFYNSDFLIYSSMASFYIPCLVMLILYCKMFRSIRQMARRSVDIINQTESVLFRQDFGQRAECEKLTTGNLRNIPDCFYANYPF